MMRDILDKINLLIESTGLAGRKPGDIFKNDKGDQITFTGLQFVPSQGGKLEAKDLEKALLKLEKQGINVHWQNGKTAKSGGYAIATFDTKDGELYYGYFKDSIKPNKTDNFIPNQVDGYRLASKSAVKMQSGLTPQDLLKQRLDNLNSKEIIKQLSDTLGATNPLVMVAKQVASGAEFPIKFPAPKDVSFEGFRDYFCEILQPMALQAGSYTGNAGEAAEIFLDGSFAGTLISFDFSKNAGLSDSTLTNKAGKTVKVSSKGGKGAEASVKNLYEALRELEKSPNGKKLAKKHEEAIGLINNIALKGQVGSPLYLGVEYDIIDDADAKQIMSLRDSGPIDLDKIDKLKISKNLKKLAKERKTKDTKNVNLFYHLMASVAHAAAKEVNNDTKFSKAAADILNNGSLIQVYTKAKDAGKEWILQNFDTVYPGSSIKGIYLSASKNYSSTSIKGNYTFLIDKGQGKPKDSDPAGAEPENISDKKPTVKLAKAADIITKGIGRKPRAVAAKAKPTNVGRQKRK